MVSMFGTTCSLHGRAPLLVVSWFAACGLGSHLRRFVPQNFLVRNVENERWVVWSRSLLSAVLELLSVAKGIGWKIWSESQKTVKLCQGCLFCAFLRACDLLSPFLSWWSASLCQTPEGKDLLSAYSQNIVFWPRHCAQVPPDR